MTPADRKLESMKRQVYANHGLVRITMEDDECQRIFDIARELGCDAWDLEVTRCHGGHCATWMDGDDKRVIVIPSATDPRTMLRPAIGANSTSTTATGRTYRHAASPEAMAKLHAATGAISDVPPPKWASETGANSTQLDRIEAKLDRLIAKYAKD